MIRDEAAAEYERVPRSALNFFQGDLKELSTTEYEKLKKNILEEGFFEPIETWRDSADTLWVIDGHHRLQVLDRERWELPNGIPIRPMLAESREQAAKRLLMVGARYAKVTGQGLYEFVHEFNIDIESLADFAPQEIKYEPFVEEFFAEKDEEEKPEPLPKPKITSNNDLEIPTLRPDMLYEDISGIPTSVWTGLENTKAGPQTLFLWSKTIQKAFRVTLAHGGILCFYEDDIKSAMVWNSPDETILRFKKIEWAAIIEPNWSMVGPLIAQLYNLYRIRYIGRLLQERGYRVIPNLQTGDSRTYELSFTTIPQEAPIVSCGIQGVDHEARKRLKAAIDMVKPQHIIIYGGSSGEKNRQFVRSLPKGPEYHALPTWTSLRMDPYKKSGQRLSDGRFVGTGRGAMTRTDDLVR